MFTAMILSRIARPLSGSSSSALQRVMMFSVRYGLKIKSLKKGFDDGRSVSIGSKSLFGNIMFLKQFSSESPLRNSQNMIKFICAVPYPNPSYHNLYRGMLVPRDFHTTMHLPRRMGVPGINESPKSKYNEVVVRQEEKLRGVCRGDFINLPELLFTKDRDYLVRCNSDKKVKAEQLAGKTIALLFVLLSESSDLEKECITYLKDIYNDLLPKGCFEVIFVAIDDADDISRGEISIHSQGDGHKYFEHKLSSMPWCAIPLSDITCRKRLQRRFGVLGIFPASFVLDSKGIVLQYSACEFYKLYGTLGYPFSRERLQSLDDKDFAVAKRPSLRKLLGSPQRDYLISNNGDKVPIHTLEDKVVALYFYEDGRTYDELTIKLETAYKELAKNNIKFEVVLLYLYDTRDTYNCTDKESFWKKFKSMPWLALPFKDPNHKKLKRIFCYRTIPDNLLPDPMLVIFGPRGKFIDPCAADILMDFEATAYPFTRKKLAKLHAEKFKELKLEMLWDPNTLFTRKDGSQVRLSQLSGKRIVIYYDMYKFKHNEANTERVKRLGRSYSFMKGSRDEFEVIHIQQSLGESEFYVDLPWVVHYAVDGYSVANELLPAVLGFGEKTYNTTSLLAFDRDGSLVRRTLGPSILDMKRPFSHVSLEEEALEDLNLKYRWCEWDEFFECSYPNWGRIYRGGKF